MAGKRVTGRDGQDEGGAKVGLPAMDLSLAFPQATPASIFPPSASDYYQSDDLLTSEERSIRMKVRGIMEKEIAPIMSAYWEKAEFPFNAIPKLASLGVAGGTIKGYGCPGLSITASAVTMSEIARVDASCSTFILVHSSLAMVTIGSEAGFLFNSYYLVLRSFCQLPLSIMLELNCCLSILSEEQLFADPRLRSRSTCHPLLNLLLLAVGFIVRKGAPGLKATKIENKIGLRMVQNGDIVLNKVFVPDEDRLPGINSFQDISKVLAISRIMVAWQPVGISMGVFDMCHRYLKERKQFGVPLAAFQLNQEKLARMLGNVQSMVLVGWRLCKLYESGKMTPGHASLGKAWNSRTAREVVSLGRELLGGNGILADFLVAKAFCDLEPIYSYEGTYDINSLVTGREVTGIASFRPAAPAKARL
ncbi:hypothetical protein Zm00014a_033633 [Zea mays]|uniref:Acyl-coenzyme A oxidase 4, peroxisomal n=1 Tax=Zea mays TaxID=4577 RepID=A0A3L6FBN0_MAIZE|nr:Acyl-coenzyme A oxidase 4, peroxisomal [Zea mays]PWZ30634.1 hypothetical protein Zm00014a_033633 [Zea mays]